MNIFTCAQYNIIFLKYNIINLGMSQKKSKDINEKKIQKYNLIINISVCQL